MFNAEKLLGQIMTEVLGSGHGGQKYKKKKSSGMVNSLSSSLMSGKGLMTAIGLGVGAYEILKSKQGGSAPPPADGYGSAPAVSAMTPPPPPIPGSVPRPSVNPLQDVQPVAAIAHDETLALRMIQVMIAASHADGQMDSAEEEKILGRLQGQGIGQEERQFILAEMHSPKTIAQLTAGITDPRVAQTMYSLAVSAIVVDTPEERAWLDQLAAALSISDSMRRFIEAEE